MTVKNSSYLNERISASIWIKLTAERFNGGGDGERDGGTNLYSTTVQ
jgi:hypothetical protein